MATERLSSFLGRLPSEIRCLIYKHVSINSPPTQYFSNRLVANQRFRVYIVVDSPVPLGLLLVNKEIREEVQRQICTNATISISLWPLSFSEPANLALTNGLPEWLVRGATKCIITYNEVSRFEKIEHLLMGGNGLEHYQTELDYIVTAFPALRSVQLRLIHDLEDDSRYAVSCLKNQYDGPWPPCGRSDVNMDFSTIPTSTVRAVKLETALLIAATESFLRILCHRGVPRLTGEQLAALTPAMKYFRAKPAGAADQSFHGLSFEALEEDEMYLMQDIREWSAMMKDCEMAEEDDMLATMYRSDEYMEWATRAFTLG